MNAAPLALKEYIQPTKLFHRHFQSAFFKARKKRKKSVAMGAAF
jgi:hypothetical protein